MKLAWILAVVSVFNLAVAIANKNWSAALGWFCAATANASWALTEMQLTDATKARRS